MTGEELIPSRPTVAKPGIRPEDDPHHFQQIG